MEFVWRDHGHGHEYVSPYSRKVVVLQQYVRKNSCAPKSQMKKGEQSLNNLMVSAIYINSENIWRGT
ncbi:unnamed protein product [Acanthoscelides obtectus]|uniref:Uncharacterized protein n=1 Tax=Acanthoscelides obtectus TaxID=200917 RepID=A0A9P0PB65_ACAOB|nr:unnamed protein product [Acanthoscelides obtectus]CAK1669299.1 hypothetical protein AOBTE_LOCUS26940 [Acanthoscelides obtectus]